MKERPILFSAPMVRAILAGTKTQTRRVVKYAITGPNQPHEIFDWHNAKGEWLAAHGGAFAFEKTNAALLCPYGQPGDRLFVREEFSGPHYQSKSPPREWSDSDPIWYWADGNPESGDWTKPKPSIHMPRWASRILLEVTGVRVERLQDISEADSIAEGTTPSIVGDNLDHMKYRAGYQTLWESINGPGSWEANPWVWVIEFKRIDNA